MSKPEAPSQAEPREEPCVWEQRDPEEREILMDPDTGDGSCREPQVGVGRERSPHPSMSSGGQRGVASLSCSWGRFCRLADWAVTYRKFRGQEGHHGGSSFGLEACHLRCPGKLETMERGGLPGLTGALDMGAALPRQVGGEGSAWVCGVRDMHRVLRMHAVRRVRGMSGARGARGRLLCARLSSPAFSACSHRQIYPPRLSPHPRGILCSKDPVP